MKLFRYFILLLFIQQISCSMPYKNVRQEKHEYTNHLIHESSPYLLQHAHNPVDWYPWGEEALEKAKRENKMLIISIGYAACHWCHVMEHESFEDTTVAKIMNENFVCIKVDREERPDVDDVYMTACQLSSQRGCGWPLNSFALADGRPVWAGTYFPKKQWMNVLDQFADMQKNEADKLETAAASLTGQIGTVERIEMNLGEKLFKKEDLDEVVEKFVSNTDFRKGGGKRAPKFPMPNGYQFLLKYHHATKDKEALRAVTVTLDNMAAGGIYDQLGGGFARYSTDMDWKVPHFEKMLYDNGQLVSLYTQAYQVTGNVRYKEVVEQTLDFIAREMTAPEGGFYSSLDADSEGEEGKFYVWTKAEIDSLLTDKFENDIFCDFYDVSKRGNWEAGTNILLRKQTTAVFAEKHDMDEKTLKAILEKSSKILMAARDKRIRPGLDDKVLTSWNALMLKGYVDAYKAFGKEDYRQSALKNANFIIKNMLHDDGRLNRNYKDGKSVINAFLDDYALTIAAFTALYEITFDEKWLNHADNLAEYVHRHFYDEETGMYFYTSDVDPALVARKMEVTDNVIPGSNSTMARSLYRLGHFLDKSVFTERAEAMLHNMQATVVGHPSPRYYSNWCNLYYEIAFPAYEMVILGNDFESKRNAVLENYMPNVIVLGGKNEGNLALLKNRLQKGETMIYVCQDKVCKFPVKEVEAAMKLVE